MNKQVNKIIMFVIYFNALSKRRRNREIEMDNFMEEIEKPWKRKGKGKGEKGQETNFVYQMRKKKKEMN